MSHAVTEQFVVQGYAGSIKIRPRRRVEVACYRPVYLTKRDSILDK